MNQIFKLCNPITESFGGCFAFSKEYSARTSLTIASSCGLKKAAEALIERGLDVLDVNTEGFRAIDFAFLTGYPIFIAFLLDQRNNPCSTAIGVIECAVISRSPDFLQLLLERGALPSVNYQSELLLAALRGHEKCVRLLLGGGAHADERINSKNSTTVIIEILYMYTSFVEVLLEGGASSFVTGRR